MKHLPFYILPYGVLIWYFLRGRKTNLIIFFIFMMYFLSMFGAVAIWLQGV